MKNKLRNLSGFKQGPAQSLSASKYDHYSREEHKEKFPNLKFTYGGPFDSVKSVKEKTPYEIAGKPVINTNFPDLEKFKKEADENKAMINTNRLGTIAQSGRDQGAVAVNAADITKLWEFYTRDKSETATSHIKPEGIVKDVKPTNSSSDLELLEVSLPVKNAKEKKTITRPDVFSDEYQDNRRNRK